MTVPVDNPAGREAVAAYVATRDALIKSASPSADSARRHAGALDAAIRLLAESAALIAPARKEWAVTALGGYGARRLLPWSDIDLLIAVDGRSDEYKGFVEAMLYPLWDAGLAVGHSVRDRRDAAAMASEDVANLTAMCTSRIVAGSPAVFAQVVTAAASKARKRPAKPLAILRERVRRGSPFELWPDLKAGRGGQRDLDELTWTAALLGDAEAWDPSGLVALGLLAEDEAAGLVAAGDIVTGARWAAHASHQRGDNRFDEDVAARHPDIAARINAALADIDAITARVRERCRERFPVKGDPPTAAAPPGLPALDMLMDPGAGVDDLERAAWAGAFDTAVPGFSRLMVLRRPALSHRFTVGDHSLRAAALVREAAATDPRAATVLADHNDLRLTIVAALLHDIGKRSVNDDHGLAGAPIAREAALQLGLGGPDAKAVSSLVRDHLLLAQTAAAADIDDEDLVTEVAARVGSARLVGPLYVLTMVDSLATGADMWSPWKAALVGELAGKIERLLSGGDARTLAGQAGTVREEAIQLARFEQVPGAIADFARHAPLRYLAEHTPEEVVDHARLAFTLAQGSRTGAARLEVRNGPLSGTWRVTVVALDRPGLLATLAGVFVLSGLDILAVAAHTTARAVALDTFVLTGATLADVDSSVWAKVERSLAAALEGKLAVPTRLAERRRHYRGTERTVKAKATWDATGDFTTAIKVKAADRVGLLHDLAGIVAESGLDIRSVTAVTSDGVARDTFQVVDAYGEPPRDARVLDELGVRLCAVAGTLESAPTLEPTGEQS